MRRSRQHLLARHQGAAQPLQPTTCSGPRRSRRSRSADLHPGAEQLSGAAQRLDRRRRRGPLAAVAPDRRRAFSCPTSSRRGDRRGAMSTALMDTARYTFVLDIPPDFERDVRGRPAPAVQVDVDATAMMQAGIGAGYITADHRLARSPASSRAPASRAATPVDARMCASPSTRT